MICIKVVEHNMAQRVVAIEVLEAMALPDIDMSKLRMAGAGAAVVGSAVSAELAWLHARSLSALGVICGGATPHCGWCVSTVALAGLAAAALAVEFRSRRQAMVAVRAKAASRR